MKQIVCLAPSKWSGSPERTQHLMRMLTDVDIIYFELSVTSSLRKCLFRSFSRESREPHPGVKVYRVPTIFYWGDGTHLLERWSRARAVRFICRALKKQHARDALLWCATPVLTAYRDKIPHSGLIYDCYRSWEKYPEQLESALTCDADLVLAASENLLEHVSPCNRNVFLLPYGVNYNLYAKGKDPELSMDAAIARLRRPVFGYLGNVERSLRLSDLIYVARQHPEWSFAIIGRVRANHPELAELKKCKNIHCIGHRSPADVPACLAACDVCIDLLHNDLADEDVIPERIYAYFAAEKPVACVYPRRYVPEFPDVIYGGQTAEEFEHACLRAANELGHRKAERRNAYAMDADWSKRGETLRQILQENGLL